MDSPANRPIAITLHASAVVCPKGTLLFLGHAGAGKSTVARLLSERFDLLADDVVYLLPQDDDTWHVAAGGREAHEGPPAEKTVREMCGVPLHAIFRLYKQSRPRIVQVGARETCRDFMDSVFEIEWQRKSDVGTNRRVFAALAQASRTRPGYRLYSDGDWGTSSLVFRKFGSTRCEVAPASQMRSSE